MCVYIWGRLPSAALLPPWLRVHLGDHYLSCHATVLICIWGCTLGQRHTSFDAFFGMHAACWKFQHCTTFGTLATTISRLLPAAVPVLVPCLQPWW